jgi:Xaa-Pro dipeptidase
MVDQAVQGNAPAVSDAEIGQRIARLQSSLQESGLAGVICFGAHRDYWPADLRYLARWSCTDEELSFVFVPAIGATTLVTDAGWDLERARTEACAGEVVFDASPARALAVLVKAHAGRGDRVGVSGFEVFPAPIYMELLEACGSVTFEPATAMVAALRLVKSETEIALLRAAAHASDSGMRAGLDQIREGASEFDVVAAAEEAIRHAGAELSFVTVMGAGPRTAQSTFFPSARPIERGDLAVLDCGARIEGYHGDMCRTVTVGPPDRLQLSMLEAVDDGLAAAIDAARPGARVGDVTDAAHHAAVAAGFGNHWWGYYMPHGTGVGQHDMPNAQADRDLRLEPGMVLCIEPGITVPEVGAVILEQMIVLTGGEPEVLNALPVALWR